MNGHISKFLEEKLLRNPFKNTHVNKKKWKIPSGQNFQPKHPSMQETVVSIETLIWLHLFSSKSLLIDQKNLELQLKTSKIFNYGIFIQIFYYNLCKPIIQDWA